MKKMMIAVIGLVLLTPTMNFANPGNGFQASNLVTIPVVNTVDEPFKIEEEIAHFPGGDMAFEKFIQKNIQYPVIAKAQGIQGKVIVALTIDETGAVTNIQVMQGIGGGCEEEVVRVLSEMPNWAPTKQAGNYVKLKKTFSFNFQL